MLEENSIFLGKFLGVVRPSMLYMSIYMSEVGSNIKKKTLIVYFLTKCQKEGEGGEGPSPPPRLVGLCELIMLVNGDITHLNIKSVLSQRNATKLGKWKEIKL